MKLIIQVDGSDHYAYTETEEQFEKNEKARSERSIRADTKALKNQCYLNSYEIDSETSVHFVFELEDGKERWEQEKNLIENYLKKTTEKLEGSLKSFLKTLVTK